jgi:hypothetical protein
MTRIAWLFGNWLARIVFAFRIGWRDGSMLHPKARPNPVKANFK